MAYQKGYVVSIIPTKTNKPVREHSENGERVCKLEFDSEYKIRLKNTTGAPALASIIIDGTPISTAGDFIINHGDTVDVERFVDSLSVGKKFKFVRKDHAEIQDPTVSELGLVEVMFTPARYKYGLSWDVLGTLNNPGTLKRPHYTIGPTMWSSGDAAYTNNMTHRSDVISTDYIGVIEGCNTSVGGTVGGSESAQKFTTTSNYEANGTTETIKIRLRGPEVSTKPEVKAKPAPSFKDNYVVLVCGVEVPCTKEVKINDTKLEMHIIVPIGDMLTLTGVGR